MRDHKRGLGRAFFGGRLADADFAEDQEEEAKERAEKMT
jgi:hypothetical protein